MWLLLGLEVESSSNYCCNCETCLCCLVHGIKLSAELRHWFICFPDASIQITQTPSKLFKEMWYKFLLLLSTFLCTQALNELGLETFRSAFVLCSFF